MSGDPYLIEGPALISFSGGRTSGYMLKHILDAHGGTLPVDVHVAFANTGREMPETLDFVQECSERWNVPITWLEYDPAAEHKTAIVNHNSASRDGEPFAALIGAKNYLPNPVTRFCTVEMKIRRFSEWCHKVHGWDHWANVVGLRADEAPRVEKALKRNALRKERWQTVMPLAEAGVTKAIVKAFWDAQHFDLRLLNVGGSTPDGNCDLCFLKGPVNIKSTMRRRPETAAWWIEQENRIGATSDEPDFKASGAVFRADRPSYAALFQSAKNQSDLFAEPMEDSLDCACTD